MFRLLKSRSPRGGGLWPLLSMMLVFPLVFSAAPARSGAPVPPVITAVSAGAFHTCALTSAGGVKCWGYNANGEMGDGTNADFRPTPVDVVGLSSGVVAISAGGAQGTYGHTCALLTTGVVKCWGDNRWGELGDGTTTMRNTPVKVHGLPDGAVAVSAGGGYTCAVTTLGAAKCWGGMNYWGELGDGTTTVRLTPVGVVGLGSGVASISADRGDDDAHTCAVTTAGAAKCWGENTSGELGNGTTSVEATTTPVDVTGLGSGVTAVRAAASHTCALTGAGAAKCWGTNGFGQLGDGTTTERHLPTNVSGLGSGVAQVEPGWYHGCARTSGGGVRCWGRGSEGELGNGTNTWKQLTSVAVNGLASGVASISVGALHACALSTAGAVSCWGINWDGELGDGTTTHRSSPVPVHWYPTITLTKRLVPASDPGRFDLNVGGTTVKASAGDGDSGTTEVTAGTYTLSEVAAAGSSLSDYTSSIACTVNDGAGPSGSGTTLQVTVGTSDTFACTITNTRKASITLAKHLVPSSDAGRFDLNVAGTVVKAAAGDGDSGSTQIAPGTYTVQEIAASGTTLANYASTIACTRNGNPGPSGIGTSLQVTVAASDVLVCTTTNTRKATISVTKHLVPVSDPGRFDLKVAGTVVKGAAADGDSGSRQVGPGTYRVSEAAASGASLSTYTSSIACTRNGGAGPAAGGTTHLDVTVAAGDVLACTITNRRKATITLTKHLMPSADAGRFDLKVGGAIVKTGAGDGDWGSTQVGAGAYTLSETAGLGTLLTDYTSSIACSLNGNPGAVVSGTSLKVTVATGDVLACTITNERK